MSGAGKQRAASQRARGLLKREDLFDDESEDDPDTPRKRGRGRRVRR